MNTLIAQPKALYDMGVVKRSLIILIAFQVILWLVFTIAYLLNPGSWGNEIEPLIRSGQVVNLTLEIFGRNIFLLLLIVFGNLFVRFGAVTPGLLILLIQGILIGWVAGSNAFEYPFASVLEANIQYLKVGLWETTAYALICGVTLTKSLYIADTFPAKTWSQVRKLKDLKFSTVEKLMALLSVILLATAAYIEAVLLYG